jgi:hypothetical protein
VKATLLIVWTEEIRSSNTLTDCFLHFYNFNKAVLNFVNFKISDEEIIHLKTTVFWVQCCVVLLKKANVSKVHTAARAQLIHRSVSFEK